MYVLSHSSFPISFPGCISWGCGFNMMLFGGVHNGGGKLLTWWCTRCHVYVMAKGLCFHGASISLSGHSTVGQLGVFLAEVLRLWLCRVTVVCVCVWESEWGEGGWERVGWADTPNWFLYEAGNPLYFMSTAGSVGPFFIVAVEIYIFGK